MNLSLKKERDMGIYVHIPFCKQKCIYCDFAAYPNLDSWHESYVSYLLQEIDLRLNMQSELTRLPVDTIYFGGGTPTNIALPLLERILLYLQERFFVSQDAEISIEANPADCDSQEMQS